jgi:c-di-GMP-related signal transduction protein
MQILSTCYVNLNLLKYTQKASLTQELSDQTQEESSQSSFIFGFFPILARGVLQQAS